MTRKQKRFILLNIPYVIVGLFATNLGEAWRLAKTIKAINEITALGQALPVALSDLTPSLVPFDLMVGVFCGVLLKVVVYVKGKNAKKYRHGAEYGTARWGNAQDIEPFIAPNFRDNIILTQTERLMMNSRPKRIKYGRNKNVLITGGSGSGKTRFFLIPNLLQMHSKRIDPYDRTRREIKCISNTIDPVGEGSYQIVEELEIGKNYTAFGYYDTFVIEEKYGLNKSTKKTFILDIIKTIFVGSAISFVLTAGIMFLFERFGNAAILISSAVMVLVVLVVALIIVPLMRIYNKFTPLEEGELREKLVELCNKYGMKIKKIVVMDASKRTTRSNAFCAGYGKRKTISLDDNLVNNYEDEEIVAVFAHELAHAKLKHVLKSMPFTVLRILLIFTGLRIVLNYLPFYKEFGFNGVNYIWAQNVLTFVTWPLSKGLDAVSNYISRRHEYQADAFAAKEGYGVKLISALKRLEKESLADINPHPLKVVLDYSHPTLSQRITAIEDIGEVT